MHSCLHGRLNPALDQLFAADSLRRARPLHALLQLRDDRDVMRVAGLFAVAARIFSNSHRSALRQV